MSFVWSYIASFFQNNPDGLVADIPREWILALESNLNLDGEQPGEGIRSSKFKSKIKQHVHDNWNQEASQWKLDLSLHPSVIRHVLVENKNKFHLCARAIIHKIYLGIAVRSGKDIPIKDRVKVLSSRLVQIHQEQEAIVAQLDINKTIERIVSLCQLVSTPAKDGLTQRIVADLLWTWSFGFSSAISDLLVINDEAVNLIVEESLHCLIPLLDEWKMRSRISNISIQTEQPIQTRDKVVTRRKPDCGYLDGSNDPVRNKIQRTRSQSCSDLHRELLSKMGISIIVDSDVEPNIILLDRSEFLARRNSIHLHLQNKQDKQQ